MSFFKEVDMNDVRLRMHQLDSDESQQGIVELNSKQQSFMKRYLKFQARLLAKLLKDNKMKDGYAIIIPVPGSGHSNFYLLVTQNVFYYIKNDGNSMFRYRIIKGRLLLEYALYPSPAFEPTKIETYKSFFTDLFKMIECIMSYPSQFLISSKDGVTNKEVDSKVEFSQIQKFL